MVTPQAPPARAASHALGLALQSLALAAAGVAVFGGALGYFFSQDDFAGLARVRGLIPPLASPWRYVPGQVYYELMEHLAGLDPVPYRAASLALHAFNTLMVRALVRRSLGAPAAFFAAAFFAAHPAHYTALYWVSGIGDLLALALALATALLALRGDAARWLAVPLFAFALASKEAVVLLPLWILLVRALPAGLAPVSAPGARRAPGPLDAALAALSGVFVAWFLVADVIGIRGAGPGPSAYELRFDGTLAGNLLTYLGWTANHFIFSVRSFSDALDPRMFPWGGAAMILGIAGAWVPQLRARGWVPGAAWYLALLLPALPLPHHTYHYYLYAPLPGVAWCLAALAEWAVLSRLGAPSAAAESARAARPTRAAAHRRRRRPAPAGRGSGPASGGGAAAWAAAGALGLACVANGALLARKIETYPFVAPEMRADPTVDRALIARRARDDLAAAGLPGGARVVFWSPDSITQAQAGRPGAMEGYADRNVRTALYDGLAARVLFPEVREAYFSRSLAPPDSATRYAIYRRDGHLKVVDGPTLDSLIRASRTP